MTEPRSVSSPGKKGKKPRHYVTAQKAEHHAEILANRIRKRFRHLSRRFKRESIDCFRLYDWDIAEVRAVVDWYAGHAVIAEYVRLQTGPQWLPRMARAVAEALELGPDKVHIRRRTTGSGRGGARYKRLAWRDQRFAVNERDLKFWVNLDDYLDTGLFSDHRETRMLIRRLAKGQDVLNLFAYTGAFTCAAAAGGARTTVTVDRSQNYLDWARDNLALNNVEPERHEFVRSDAGRFLDRAARDGRRFTLAFVDPPSFFQDTSRRIAFDINRHHPDLLRRVLAVMKSGATVVFSTNHQRFLPHFDRLPLKHIEDITEQTIPEDYRNRQVHRCWRMVAS